MAETLAEETARLLAPAGIVLDSAVKADLNSYAGLLLSWNLRMDLTAVPAREMALKHFADSLLVLAQAEFFPEGAALIDVGSGAGFPGLALAVARRDLSVCLLESQQKKCAFLKEVIGSLGLENASVLCSRAETAARGGLRERFDLATARALAPMNVLAEYLLPFLRIGGRMLCWKGPSLSGEMAAADRAIRLLGGQAGPQIALPLPGREHRVQVIHKVAPTPPAYPRKPGMPGKKPL